MTRVRLAVAEHRSTNSRGGNEIGSSWLHLSDTSELIHRIPIIILSFVQDVGGCGIKRGMTMAPVSRCVIRLERLTFSRHGSAATICSVEDIA